MGQRHCYACGSDKTYRDPHGYENWFLNRDSDNNVLCNPCYDKYCCRHKWIHNKLRFKDKRKTFRTTPRVGVCNLCRAVRGFDCKVTNMDHIWYDDNNPLVGAIESCFSCHNKRHVWLRKMEKLVKPVYI